jgi:hypothetical protein
MFIKATAVDVMGVLCVSVERVWGGADEPQLVSVSYLEWLGGSDDPLADALEAFAEELYNVAGKRRDSSDDDREWMQKHSVN